MYTAVPSSRVEGSNRYLRRVTRIALVVLAGLTVRLWLIAVFPMIFGNDTMVRLVNADKVLMSYQLPLLQLCIHLLSLISTDPLLIRVFMAAMGALAGAGFYLLVEHLVGEHAALWAALLFTGNPFIAGLSTVPYQEIVMMAGLLFAFHYFFGERWGMASLCLGLACLTRFEAWIACPVLAVAYFAARRKEGWLRMVKAVALFGWAPLVWIVFRHGLSPAGSFVIDRSVSIWRLQRIVYIGWIAFSNTPMPILLLACVGFAVIIRRAGWRDRRLQVLAAFLLLFLIAVIFSAHGEPPDPERHVTMREAHIPIAGLTLLAAFAFVTQSRAGTALGVVAVGWCIVGCYGFVRTQTSRADIQLAYQAGRFLDEHTRADEQVLVLAAPISDSDLRLFLDKVQQTSGEAGLAKARLLLAEVDTSPLDYQRILIHSRLGRARLRPYEHTRQGAQWLVAWSNFKPDGDTAAWLLSQRAETTLQWGDRSLSIYRVN